MTEGMGGVIPKHTAASRIQRAYRRAKEAKLGRVESKIDADAAVGETKSAKPQKHLIDQELQMRDIALSKALDIAPVTRTSDSEIGSILDQQQSIFSKVDFTAEDRIALDKLQHKFEEAVNFRINYGNTIPGIDLTLQSTFYSVVSESGNIQFQDGFPDEIKQHICCTVARLMMCPSGAKLIQEIMRGNFPVNFVVGDADCGMVASPLDEVSALVKNVRYEDSETEKSSESDMTSDGSEVSIDGSNTEDIIDSMRRLTFRANEKFNELPTQVKEKVAIFDSWRDVNKLLFYPLKRNEGSGSLVTVSGYIRDGSITVGGEDSEGALKEILCPSFIVLGHELIHVLHNQLGLNLRNVQREIFDTRLPNSFSTLEEFETITGEYFSVSENQLRVESGFNEKYGLRTGHLKTTM